MTPAQELTHHLRRHNATAKAKALSSAGIAVLAWVLCPVLVGAVCHVATLFFKRGQTGDAFLDGTLVYASVNLLLVFWRILLRQELNYDAQGALFPLLFWPAYMVAEAVNQTRAITRLSVAEHAQAQSLLLRLHLAGPDGMDRAPNADDAELIEKLEEIGALRSGMPRTDGIRLYRRAAHAEGAVAETLDPRDQPPIGLIAGGGDLPLLQANGMHAAGRRVVGIGLRGQYATEFPSFCDEFVELSPLRPSGWVRQLRRRGVFEAVMVGHIQKTRMYNPLDVLAQCPDFMALHLWFIRKRHDRRSQGLLGALTEALKEKGILLVSTTAFIPDHLATRGIMTSRCAPTESQRKDIHLAIPLLIQLNQLDIGQGLCVKNGDVIALEAMEGTDRMIARAGELCPRGGWTLVKGADLNKDPRFDVPTVGVTTIENLKKAGATCLALVAGRTIMANRPAVLKAADQAGIAVFGFEME